MARLSIGSTGQPVQVETLDSLLGHLQHVDLLKIDTEGSEDAVLAGARHLLTRTERVVMEYHGSEKYELCRQALRAGGFMVIAADKPSCTASLGLIFAERDHTVTREEVAAGDTCRPRSAA